MALTINHQTNDISATSGSVTIDGAAAGGGGGALEFVSKTTVSSSVAQVDFTSLDDDAVYRIIGKYVVFSESTFPKIDLMNASNVIQTSCCAYRRDGSSTLTITSGQDFINCYTLDTNRHGFVLDLSTKADGNWILYRGHAPKSAGAAIIHGSYDANNTSTRIGGIRWRPNGGTISSGQFLLYKYKES